MPTDTARSASDRDDAAPSSFGEPGGLGHGPGRDLDQHLDDYFAAARSRGCFAGQVSAEFQAALARRHRRVELPDCEFYHSMDFPDGATVGAEWDLRGAEADYTGHFPFAGKRVLELGPASGCLTAYMDRCGAEVTVFDLPFGAGPELVPYAAVDLEAQRRSGAQSAERLRNSWWYAKRALGFRARAVYGDIYDLPDDLGRFDVALFGSVLLHLRDPFRALERATAITDEAIVVTEVLGVGDYLPAAADAQFAVPIMVFNPTPPPVGLVHWWSLSPGAVVQMLRVLGFTETTLTIHAPAAMRSPPTMFTVVGRRPPGAAAAAGAPAQARDMTGLPLPSPELRRMVAGTEDASVFLDLGRRAFDALVATLREAGVEPAELGAVLDFGCGVGRVMRYWHDVPVDLYGTDINPDLIDWAREHLPFARFQTNPLEGPLAYPDRSFGLVYALSVFTHLTERMQFAWLDELLRVLRPGGLLYFTTHGEWYSHRLPAELVAEFDRGRLVVTGEEREGANYCGAFHPESYVHELIAARPALRLVSFRREGALGNPKQDSWLVQKLADGTEHAAAR